MDYAKLIHTIIDPFIENPDSVLIKDITEDKENGEISYLISAPSNDIAKLIGRKGCIANSIRNIVSIAGKLEEKRVHLKFESFEEENKGE
jgi:predicted RNA-binding protein YlqC (UPF0109 family)